MTSKRALEDTAVTFREWLMKEREDHNKTKTALEQERTKQQELLTAVIALMNLSDAYQDITTEVEVPEHIYGGYRSIRVGTKMVNRTDKGVDRFRKDLLAAQDALHGEAALKKIRDAIKGAKK